MKSLALESQFLHLKLKLLEAFFSLVLNISSVDLNFSFPMMVKFRFLNNFNKSEFNYQDTGESARTIKDL